MERILAKVTRGNFIESIHYGHIVVVDKAGRIIESLGNEDVVTFIRSAAKPLQVVPVVATGAADYFNLVEEELALMTASHSGEEQHERVGTRILAKLDLSENYLACGVHPPQNFSSAKKLYWEQKEPGPLHCNCSGKHLGMLALAKFFGFPLKDYIKLDHPVQGLIIDTIAEYSKFKRGDFKVGLDGCGVPVFAMPLKHMALAYAQLVGKAKEEIAPLAIVKSMITHPFMVAGTERLCTELMQKTNGRLIAKVGSEGIYCVGLIREEIGIAIKVIDGSPRPLGPVIIEVLKKLDLLSQKELDSLGDFHTVKLKNHRKEVVGTIEPSFQF